MGSEMCIRDRGDLAEVCSDAGASALICGEVLAESLTQEPADSVRARAHHRQDDIDGFTLTVAVERVTTI